VQWRYCGSLEGIDQGLLASARKLQSTRQRQRQTGRARDTERNKNAVAETETQGEGKLLLHRSQRSGAAQALLTPAPLNPSTGPAPSARGDEGGEPVPLPPGQDLPKESLFQQLI
jgi:hypothetical protein